jgi:acid phosphatase type 7
MTGRFVARALFAGLMVWLGVSGAIQAQQVFVGAGDIATASMAAEATARVVDDVVRTARFPVTVFTAGDNAYPDGAAADFAKYYHPAWGRHLARTRPAPGNHEYKSAGAAPYFEYFGANAGPAGRGYYGFALGDWKIIALNSSVPADAESAQMRWLRAELQSDPRPCTLAYWHHSRFSSGAAHGSIRRVGALFDALYEAGADVVITAHDHIYERFATQDPDGQADPDGIRVFVVGTGGGEAQGIGVIKPNSEVRDGAARGVLKLTLNAADYAWEFLPVEGGTFRDSGSGSCRQGGRRTAPR